MNKKYEGDDRGDDRQTDSCWQENNDGTVSMKGKIYKLPSTNSVGT